MKKRNNAWQLQTFNFKILLIHLADLLKTAFSICPKELCRIHKYEGGFSGKEAGGKWVTIPCWHRRGPGREAAKKVASNGCCQRNSLCGCRHSNRFTRAQPHFHWRPGKFGWAMRRIASIQWGRMFFYIRSLDSRQISVDSTFQIISVGFSRDWHMRWTFQQMWHGTYSLANSGPCEKRYFDQSVGELLTVLNLVN